MKLLLSKQDFETLAVQLSKASKRFPIDAKIESYSCKMVAEEKRQYRQFLSELGINEQNCEKIFGTKLNSKADSSPILLPLHESQTVDRLNEMKGCSLKPASASGTVNNSSISLSTSLEIIPRDLFCLIGTLNLSFAPEYDFGKAKSAEFCAEPEIGLVEKFISYFCSIYVDKYRSLSNELWQKIQEEIDPSNCSIYSYLPDHTSDPYSCGCLTSFNYFFHNKVMKRILFFSVRVLNDSTALELEDDDDMDGQCFY